MILDNLLIYIILAVLLLIALNRTIISEDFTNMPLSNEAIQNIARNYNAGNFSVTDFNATGTSNFNNLVTNRAYSNSMGIKNDLTVGGYMNAKYIKANDIFYVGKDILIDNNINLGPKNKITKMYDGVKVQDGDDVGNFNFSSSGNNNFVISDPDDTNYKNGLCVENCKTIPEAILSSYNKNNKSCVCKGKISFQKKNDDSKNWITTLLL